MSFIFAPRSLGSVVRRLASALAALAAAAAASANAVRAFEHSAAECLPIIARPVRLACALSAALLARHAGVLPGLILVPHKSLWGRRMSWRSDTPIGILADTVAGGL